MRTLITGGHGMLARDMLTACAAFHPIALTRTELDITDAQSVDRVLQDGDLVINCAAYTAVDAAETDRERAFAVNADGPAHLARAVRERNGRLIHISTDYVFDGTGSRPHAEGDPRHPRSVYGQSKALGEERILEIHPQGSTVVRTAWLYGAGGGNFASTMLRLARERDVIEVVNDQYGQPTWTFDLAEQVARMIAVSAPAGIYHGTNQGATTWFEFARAVLAEAGLDPTIIQPTTSASFERPAPRPSNSVLGHDGWRATGIEPMRDWRAALHAAFAAGVFDDPGAGGSDG